jgi:hypothetical protein
MAHQGEKMSNEIGAQIVTAFSTLAAAGLGGWFVWLTTARQLQHQARADAERRFVEKMELLHGEITRLLQKAARFRIDVYTKVDAIELERYILDPAQLTMLCDFHAPSLRPTIDRMAHGLNQLSVAVYNIHAYPEASPEEKNEMLVVANEAFQETSTAAHEAKAKLRELVGPLTTLR